jgi:hypothetical protein
LGDAAAPPAIGQPPGLLLAPSESPRVSLDERTCMAEVARRTGHMNFQAVHPPNGPPGLAGWIAPNQVRQQHGLVLGSKVGQACVGC